MKTQQDSVVYQIVQYLYDKIDLTKDLMASKPINIAHHISQLRVYREILSVIIKLQKQNGF